MTLWLVTGGCGFIGSHLCAALAASGQRVRVLDNLSTGKRENLVPGAELLVGERGAGAALELAEIYADLTRSAYWRLVEVAARRIIGPRR